MLRVDRLGRKLIRLSKSALSESDYWERELQAMILANPDAFCEELGESLWMIGQEVRPSEAIGDSIDLLAVDESGSGVILELKRGTHRLQLLQALSYAGMVSRWAPEQFVQTLATNYSQSTDNARSAIEDHTGSDISEINSGQRIFLIAEDFDPALLIATEWLHENYNVDIRCYRLELSQENGSDYVTCICIYPPIEIATLTRRGSGSVGPRSNGWPDWEAALQTVRNQAVKEFFKTEVANNQYNRLRSRQLI